MPDQTIQEQWLSRLRDTTAALVGERLVAVRYFDGADDQGRPMFEADRSDDRHELLWGVDLEVDDGTVVGLIWDWCPELLCYGIGAYVGGLAGRALNAGARSFDQTDANPWRSWIGKLIILVECTKDADACEDDLVCDCRIEFAESLPVWICARQANYGGNANGDDCVVVFSEQEARPLGIRAPARDSRRRA